MTYMEHLKDNLLSYCPLVPLTEEEQRYLDRDIAQKIVGLENIPCNDCKYCMPCPYGIDIPAIFIHYNKCKNEGSLPMGVGDAEYRRHRRQYLNLVNVSQTIASAVISVSLTVRRASVSHASSTRSAI